MGDETTPAAAPATPDPEPDSPVAALELRLGVTLRDRTTALAALTHKSYVNEHRDEAQGDNERLEFLGDAVIDLAVSHRLMERFPGAREGDLSKMRAAVVDEAGLAGLARALDLGPLLRLGRGEELTGGRRKASLLADAMEAVVAAVYLDGGLEAVLGLVDRLLGDAFARAAAGTLDRDHKTQLQELAQSRVRATPRYRVVAELGPDHAKVFQIELELRGEVLATGQGKSKKDAEQAAAKAAIEVLQVRLTQPPPGPPAAEAPRGPPAAEAPRGPPAAEAVAPASVEPVEPAASPAAASLPAAEAPAGPEAKAPPGPAPRARPARVPKKKAAEAPRRKAAPRKAPARPRSGAGPGGGKPGRRPSR
jgi:ribonuclease-3